MPLLLLLPLLVLALVALWALLLPVLLVQRYRVGRRRARVQAWLVGTNAWLLLVSVGSLLASAWFAQRWLADAVAWTAGGLGAGMALGVLGLLSSRFEHQPGALHVTPNRWLVLGLTLLVAARIAVGLWQGWLHWRHGVAATGGSWLAQPGTLFAVGGVLLSYYLAWNWGLRARLRRR